MNVTFMLGNGFDIAMGLKTEYADFLNYYNSLKLDDEPPDRKDVLSAFKALIQSDIETWADLELALGANTTEIPLNDVDCFNICMDDIILRLSDYLRGQMDRINKNPNFILDGIGVAKSIAESLRGYHLLLEPKLRERYIQTIGDKFNLPNQYDFICFNYTDVIVNLISLLAKHWELTTVRQGDTLGELIHIHGTYEEMMVLGVDDVFQIREQAIRKELQSSLVKPIINDETDTGRDIQAANTIKKSDTICLYGLSLGKTDKSWWQKIGEWLLESEQHHLIILWHVKALERRLPRHHREEKDKVIERFLSYLNISDLDKAKIRTQIFVCLNKALFDSTITDGFVRRSDEINLVQTEQHKIPAYT